MLTPYLPYPLVSGGQVRTYNLLKHLSRKHEVTLFALIKDEGEREHIAHLEKYCHKVQVFKRTSRPWHPRNILMAALTLYPFVVTRNMVLSLRSAIQSELEKEKYDLIHVETFYMMPNIPKTNVPTILVEQTIEHLGYESFAKTIARRLPILQPFLSLDIAKIKYWEKKYWHSCQHLITVSEDDKEYIQRTQPDVKRIDVVSNGVDIEYFSEVKRQKLSHPTILFVGTFNWLPNVEAVEYLVDKVWPLIKEKLPHSRLRIVGSAPTKKILRYAEKDSQVIVTGRVPDIRDEYAKAHVLVAPVFSGKGTRYKVLEAMATETPVVGTGIALEGIGAQTDVDFLEGNSAEELANQTVRVLKDEKLQEKLGKSGRRFVMKNFSWDHIAAKLLDIYEQTSR